MKIIWFGLLILVLASVPASAQTIVVDDVTISEIGSTAKVNVTLTEAPDGLSGYNLSISLSNPDVAEIIAVEFPDWTNPQFTKNSSLPADQVYVEAVDVNEQVQPGATNVLLATLTIRCDGYGNSVLGVDVIGMDDDNGNPINPSVDNGAVNQPVFKVPIMNIVGIIAVAIIIAVVGVVMILRIYRK